MDKKPKTEIEQVRFYQQCLTKFHIAAEQTGIIRKYYSIAGTKVCLCFAGKSMIPVLTLALEHLSIPETDSPDMIINIWDSKSSGIAMPPPPCEWEDFTDRGDIWGFNSKRIKTAFHWSEYSVNVMDIESNTAVYWVKNPATFPYWVQSSPFRTIFHWWMERNNCQLLHAAAVGTNDGAVLITGKGGVGKSTTATICLNAGLYYLADDYVIIRKDPSPKVYSLYSTAKIKMEDISQFPSFKSFIGKTISDDQEKAVMFLYSRFSNLIKTEMPLTAILTPEIKNQKNTKIEDVDFWPVQRAMSFTTMSQLPGVGSHTHEYICEFSDKLPCYKISLGSDFNLIPSTIEKFLANPDEFNQQKSQKISEQESPLISIIVPVYNGEKFIAGAVKNILHQGYPAIEIIIVDDGSSDNTRKIVEDLSIDVRYFHQPNDGPSSARNRGIRDVSGKYVAFLDVDDLWPENNLKLLVAELEANPSVDVVRGYAQLFKNDNNDGMEYLGNPKEAFPDYIGAALYRKQAFTKVGLFDSFLKFGEDSDWFNRAREKNLNIKRLDDTTLLVRRHEGNITAGKSLKELNILKVFKKSLDRARNAGLEYDQKSK